MYFAFSVVLNALLSVEAGTAAMPNTAASLRTAKIFSHWMEGKKSKLLGHEQALRGVLVCAAVPAVAGDVGRSCLFGGRARRCSTGANVGPHALVGPVLFDRGATLPCKRWPQSRKIHAARGLAFKVEFGCFYRPVFLPVVT